MRAVLALSLLVSTSAFAKLDLALMPLSAVGEGAKIKFNERILLAANSSEMKFQKFLTQENGEYSILSCALFYNTSTRLRSISSGAQLEVTGTSPDGVESYAHLELGDSTSVECTIDAFETEANPALVTLANYNAGTIPSMQNSESRQPTIQEVNEHMPFNVSVDEIAEFSVNDDENEESVEESGTSPEQSAGASQEGYSVAPPPPPAP